MKWDLMAETLQQQCRIDGRTVSPHPTPGFAHSYTIQINKVVDQRAAAQSIENLFSFSSTEHY